MAEIVVLNRWREKQRPRPEILIGSRPETGSAQLLMFTGVRYERLEAIQPPSASQALVALEQN